VTAKTIPRHARTLLRHRRVPRPNAGRLPGPPSPGDAQPQPAGGRVRADPLAGPVAITERAVLGDRIRRPTAWCEMPCCISRYEYPAALGEADVHAGALAAGWRHDGLGRLVCPYCQQRNPGLWVTRPVAWQDRAPARGSGHDTGPAWAGRLGAVWTALSARVSVQVNRRRQRARTGQPGRSAAPGTTRVPEARQQIRAAASGLRMGPRSALPARASWPPTPGRRP
jgi:hypothetical protein